MSKVIISYKSPDKATILPLVEQINAVLDEPCSMLEDTQHNDTSQIGLMLQSLDKAAIVIVMYSRLHAAITDYTTDDTIRVLNYAQETNKRIVFIGIDNAPLTKWFIFMFPQQRLIDASSAQTLSKMLIDLPKWLHEESSIQETSAIYMRATEGLEYSFDDKKKEATVCGVGSAPTTAIIIPSQINYKGIEYSVTSIGPNAFKDFYDLTSVHLPHTIQHIEEQAFTGCTSLAHIAIPQSVMEIGPGAFMKCYSLESIIIPSEITIIEKGTFQDCKNLESVSLPDTIKRIMNYAFAGCVHLSNITLHDGLEFIGSAAFLNCNKLTHLPIPATVKKIETNAFLGSGTKAGKTASIRLGVFSCLFTLIFWGGLIVYLIWKFKS